MYFSWILFFSSEGGKGFSKKLWAEATEEMVRTDPRVKMILATVMESAFPLDPKDKEQTTQTNHVEENLEGLEFTAA